MNPVDLDAVDALAAKATPRPWFATGVDYGPLGSPECPMSGKPVYTVSISNDTPGWTTDGGCSGYGLSKENAEFIAAAINAYPTLAAHIRKLQAEINCLRGELEEANRLLRRAADSLCESTLGREIVAALEGKQ